MKFNEEDVFTILSHPVRRKILKEIFEFRSLSFSTIKSWGHSTGSIYHHLKSMNQFVCQDGNKQYILTEDGHDLCRWFLDSDGGNAKVDQIVAFSSRNALFIQFVEQHQKSSLSFMILFLISTLIVISSSDVLILGPFLFNKPASLKSQSTLLFNFLSVLICLISYSIFGSLLSKKPLKIFLMFNPKVISVFFFALAPVLLEVLIISALKIQILASIWFIIVIANQIFFLFMLAALSVQSFNTDIKTSMITAIGVSYFQLSLAFILNVVK